MKRVLSFGKIDFNGKGKKVNEVTVELSLEPNREGKYCFSACANVYNKYKTDIYMGGQCLDTIAEQFPEIGNNPLYKEILRLWQLYHLNDLNAGTVEQEKALIKAVENGELESRGANNYTECCEYLKKVGLYEVPHPDTGKPYKYGTGWLHRAIPDEDMNRIKEIIMVGE